MCDLRTRCIQMCEHLRLASGGRNTVKRGRKLSGEDNRAIFGPGPAAIAVDVTKRNGRASVNGDFPQLSVAEETDPLTVGRKEWDRTFACPTEQHGSLVVQFADVELSAIGISITRYVGHSRAIR